MSWVLLILASIFACRVFADGKGKKAQADPTEWTPYSCCHRLDDTPHRPGVLVETHLIPEFYYPDTLRTGDTTYAYICYDARDSVADADTIFDFANVSFLSLYKSFTDFGHTYRDNGKDIPLPISIIVHRYDRLSANKWNSITYPGNAYTELKEFKNDIVRTDTIKTPDTASHLTLICIYKYYKVAEMK